MGEVGIPAIKLSPRIVAASAVGREGDGMQTRESGRLGVLEFWEKEIGCWERNKKE